MAKIVHSKLDAVHEENSASKIKLLNYYFPSKAQNGERGQKAEKDLTDHCSVDSQEDLDSEGKRKTEYCQEEHNNNNIDKNCGDKSVDRELKSLKSKERLKFSKIKKS